MNAIIASTSRPADRDANLDLARALAIVLVLIYHITQWVPRIPEAAFPVLRLGAYGVDLFFVLSGYLIGTLYWNELRDFGGVDVRRFLVRRWLRTVPPYLAVLPVAYLAVYFVRGEPFHWQYLVFLQNYEAAMPFFLISWSLCVEEHFYLVLPLLLLGIAGLRLSYGLVLGALCVIGLFMPFLDPRAIPGSSFGYPYTATHLRFEGLALGVLLSYLRVCRIDTWHSLSGIARKLVVPLTLGALTIPFWSDTSRYYFGFSLVSIAWATILVVLVNSEALRISKWRITRRVALTSYSIYLVHALVVHACMRITDAMQIPREVAAPTWLVPVFFVAWCLHWIIERPAMAYRDMAFPRRTGK